MGIANSKCNFKLFRDQEWNVSQPKFGRDLIFTDPWYITLNVGQQS